MEKSKEKQDIFLEDFNKILTSINRKFEIISALWKEKKIFEIKFRTTMPKNTEDYNVFCDQWVDTFSDITNTVWAKKASNTGPKVRFRKQYQCWTHGGKTVLKELLFDARKCKATLDIKVLGDNFTTGRKNKFIRLGLNVVVKINFIHLHEVDTEEHNAFYVHNCKPQVDLPKHPVTINEKLPQLVAEMIQKGLEATGAEPLVPLTNEKPKEPEILTEEFVQETLPTFQVVQNIPIQNLNGLKLEFQPNLEQFTQFVVNDSEPLFMCQPIFDNMQFVQLNPRQNQGQFLQ